MISDQGLRLSTNENVATAFNSGNDGLGEISVNLGLEQGQLDGTGTRQIDSDALSESELSVTVTSGFTSATDNATSEFQLVSLPIALTLLTNGAGGAADGKRLSVVGAALTDAGDTVTINGHGLPLGTPIFLTNLAGTTGVANNVVYYVIPTTVNLFQLASSFANALAGTALPLTTNGTADINFIPFIHATTGQMRRPFMVGGMRLTAKVQPYHDGPWGKMQAPFAGAVQQALGAGPIMNSLGALVGGAPRPYRYLALRHLPSATMTAGSVTVDLAVNTQTGRRHYATSFESR